jgi:peptide/nickel transport system permease protein
MPIWPYGPLEVDTARVMAKPSWEHPCGHDDAGRDVLARLIHGARTSMAIGLGAVALAAALGIPLGALAGMTAGGLIDALVLRTIEVFLCFPAFFFALGVMALFGSSALTVTAVLGAIYWTRFARVVRGEFLSLREREFVVIARGLGVPAWRIVLRHMLPLARGPILVAAAFGVAGAVIVETTFSFLGLGPGLRVASWGSMLAQGKVHAHENAWHLWLFPTLAVVSAVLCFNAIADGALARRRDRAAAA